MREALERARAAAPQGGGGESSAPSDDPRLAVLIKQHKETLRRVSVLQKERAELIKERSTLSQQLVEMESRLRSVESNAQSKERTYVDKVGAHPLHPPAPGAADVRPASPPRPRSSGTARPGSG